MEEKKKERREEVGGVLYMRLADELLTYIRKMNIQPGMRIPSERKLADMFQTSRTSVREAVRILQNKGLLNIEIGKGMYLSEELPEEGCMIELWKIDYMELLDIKTTLEFHIIQEMCRYTPPADILAIEIALRMLEKSYDQGLYDQQADALFHKRIRACSSNQTMVQLIENLLLQLDAYGLGEEEFNSVWLETVPYHRALYEAIVQHSEKKAHEAFYTIYEIDKSALKIKKRRIS